MAVSTYYIDAHGGVTDASANWTNDANAFDGNTATYAIPASNCDGSSGYLQGSGSNAPGSGGAISQVRVRVFDARSFSPITINATADIYDSATLLGTATGGLNAYGSFVTLDAPSGGWDWTKLQNLIARGYGEANRRLARIELEVTYADSAGTTKNLTLLGVG